MRYKIGAITAFTLIIGVLPPAAALPTGVSEKSNTASFEVSGILSSSITITVSDPPSSFFTGYTGPGDFGTINFGSNISADCAGGASIGVPTGAKCYAAGGGGRWLVSQVRVVTSGSSVSNVEFAVKHAATSTWEALCLAPLNSAWADNSTCTGLTGETLLAGGISSIMSGEGTFDRDLAYRAGNATEKTVGDQSGDVTFTVSATPL